MSRNLKTRLLSAQWLGAVPFVLMAGWLVAALLAGCNRQADSPVAGNDHLKGEPVQSELAALPHREQIPPLDAQVPAKLSQATFALG